MAISNGENSEEEWGGDDQCPLHDPSGTNPANHQGVISIPKHKIFGKMTPSCILQDFLYLFSRVQGNVSKVSLIEDNRYI